MKRVYLDCGTLEQYNKVVEEYSDSSQEELDFVYLTGGVQIQEESAEIWQCRELDRQVRQIENCNVTYHAM